jgi:hypothetical protein
VTTIRTIQTLTVLTGISLGTGNVSSQTLEPRAYSNAPVGMNFLLAGYQHSRGALVFDPVLPVQDVNSDVDTGFIGYVRTFGISGKSAKLGAVLPYASLFVDGYVSDQYRSRDTTGIADPTVYLSVNFYGAPALSAREFSGYKQDTIAGFTLKVTAPLGNYDTDKLINIGTNRWTIEPGLGISKAFRQWTIEALLSAAFYTDNNEFDNGKTREQENIYSSQLHLTYSFTNKAWAAISTTYYTGGRTTIDDVESDDLQRNWRTGFTLALPLDKKHSLKIYGSSGVSTRTGSDFDTLGIAWQYRWGGGI